MQTEFHPAHTSLRLTCTLLWAISPGVGQLIASPKSPTCKAHSMRAPGWPCFYHSAPHPKYSSTKKSETKIGPSLGPPHWRPRRGSPAIQKIQNHLTTQKHSLKQKRGHHLQEGLLGCPLLILTLLPLRCLGVAALTTLAGAECSVKRRERWLCRALGKRPPPASSSPSSPLHSTKQPAERTTWQRGKGHCCNTSKNFISLFLNKSWKVSSWKEVAAKPQELDSEVGGLSQPYALL